MKIVLVSVFHSSVGIELYTQIENKIRFELDLCGKAFYDVNKRRLTIHMSTWSTWICRRMHSLNDSAFRDGATQNLLTRSAIYNVLVRGTGQNMTSKCVVWNPNVLLFYQHLVINKLKERRRLSFDLL